MNVDLPIRCTCPTTFSKLTHMLVYNYRGKAPDVPALDMSKWMDSNYHMLVPEASFMNIDVWLYRRL